MSCMKILLVDDAMTDRFVMTTYLEKMGHDVLTCSNGQEAVAVYQSEELDLVFMDVMMPVMDGYEAARTIRDCSDDWIPIIFLSGRAEPDDIAKGIDAGGDDYLFKPISYVVLEAKIKAMQRIATMRHNLLQVSGELEKANKALQHLANIDGLTGLSNRRHMDDFLQFEIARGLRYQQPLTVILADVDYFKRYNDHYGHLAGDDCLKDIASALTSVCQRDTDMVARYGGEEFVVILSNTPLEQGRLLAERLRQEIINRDIPYVDHDGSDVCTLSLGVYSALPDATMNAEMFLQQADFSLYKAKKGGRNQVVVSSINK
ncbi:MAG: diguanylate cyclase [Gammaproteobacteria bacterium]|nr:diguanylate cyclase [Gammaproteobacteria bacterium]